MRNVTSGIVLAAIVLLTGCGSPAETATSNPTHPPTPVEQVVVPELPDMPPIPVPPIAEVTQR